MSCDLNRNAESKTLSGLSHLTSPTMAGSKRVAKKASAGAKKGGRKGKRSFKVYIARSLKQVNKSLTVSGTAMKILNGFVVDQFDRIAVQAAQLARSTKRATLGSAEVQTAVRLLLPAELAKHAMAEGTKAVAKIAA